MVLQPKHDERLEVLGVSILLSPFGNKVLEREGASACLVNHVDGLPQPSW